MPVTPHPDWHGECYPSVLRLPDRKDLWDAYATKLGAGDTPEEGKSLAAEFYLEHREEMDAGGKVAWELDKYEDEVSALQSMMTFSRPATWVLSL